jgi:D-alanine-D-alanine ligase-like ATP-grasp enzyme
METITSIAQMRRFFRENRRPIYYFGNATHHLLGMDGWVSNFRFICRVDCFEGRHPNLFVPPDIGHDDVPEEDVVDRLLSNPEVTDHIAARGGDPAALFLMFDEKAETLCTALGMEIWLPGAAARADYGDKLETVRIGNVAGVPSVPNVLAGVQRYDQLLDLARQAGLGGDLVVQTPFGVSGQTTFFIANADDWRRHAAEIVAQHEVKIMKRIACRSTTLEACVTRCGTVVGPLLSEITGQELTPQESGWGGNEVFPDAFPDEVRAKARDYAARFGDELLTHGYRGYFDLDFLIDHDGQVYLGELNPRLTAASPITSRAIRDGLPLFLFHLLEYSGADFDLDVSALNARWADPSSIESWSEIVVPRTSDEPGVVTKAPPTGIWRLGEGGEVAYQRFDHLGTVLEPAREAFFLRVVGPGDLCYRRSGLGILMTRGRVTTDGSELNDTARAWIRGLNARYRTRPGDA